MPVTSSSLIDAIDQASILPADQLAEAKRLRTRSSSSRVLANELIRRGWLTAFQANQILAGRSRELVLGSYLLLDRIGMGGRGQIFKARHQRMNRVVAVKVLRPDLLKDNEAVQRFYREIEVVSQLSHPNVVHALEAGPMGSSLVLVLEYVPGSDLEQLVRQSGPLPSPQACDYIRQAAVGLQYAHERGLIHRDIKPSNLLAYEDNDAPGAGRWGTIKILDLGLARLQQPVKGSTTSNITILGSNSVMQGSPDYMSPEQALDFHSVDIRSDIYSLGCTFFFLLTGRPPFPAGTLAEKLMKHQQAEPALDEVPYELRPIVQKMLAKRPPDRYQRPAEAAEALQPYCTPPRESSTDTLILRARHTVQHLDLVRGYVKRGWLRLSSSTRRRLSIGLGLLLFCLLLPGNKGGNLSGHLAPTHADDGLVAHWSMDEADPTHANDSSRYLNHGVLQGKPTRAPGKVGNALVFDGRDDRMRAENIPVNTVPQGHNTVMFWMYWQGGENCMPFGWDVKYDLYFGRGHLGVNTGESGNIIGTPSRPFLNKWVHVAVVFPNDVPSPANTKLFINGIAQDIRDRATPTKGKRIATPAIVLSGWGSSTQYKFKGLVDEVRIYNRALSGEEIQEIMVSVK